MRLIIGPQILLSNMTANITGPGGTPKDAHCDQQFTLAAGFDRAMAGNAAWALTDFRAENGATRIVPGSHRSGRAPTPDDMRDAIPLEVPAGSLVALEGRVWHQTGPNSSADERRAGIFAFYAHPGLRQQENWAASLAPSVASAASPELRALTALDPVMGLGFIGGPPDDMPRG